VGSSMRSAPPQHDRDDHEGGTKAVDAGARQFSEVATAFKQIASLVGTTTEAAREIELSTKQQSTAVEQVNIAAANVAQATRETEASLSQTFQTASELANLSRDLMRLIQPQRMRSEMAKDTTSISASRRGRSSTGWRKESCSSRKAPHARHRGAPAAPGAHPQRCRSGGQATWNR